MKRRKMIGLGLMAGSAGFVAFPTGSYSTTSADRGAAIAVADNSNAYLELETDEARVTSAGETAVSVGSITNNFVDEVMTVDIWSTDVADSVVQEVYPSTRWLKPGKSTDINATVRCESGTQEVELVSVDIEASGSDTEVSTTETVEITCDVPEPPESDDSSTDSNEPSEPGEPPEFPFPFPLHR
ncbi:hypothetical protein [Natrinema halophilum]|uniref:DUF11 domain-containing protein n=1 Tax=Natrinema halophilum TaxID=1699371 RepID=A0A7D5GIQ4_9EURY|nr:hypothetical protein [Natrinema halophilum]QLG50074.1 hypothetical protein HYG82_15020 [Natrinema halophilum]